MKIFPAVDGLLVIDVGNTRVATAAWTSGALGPAQRAAIENEAEWTGQILAAWDELRTARSRAVVIGSVNAPALERVRGTADESFAEGVYLVGDDVPLPMPVDADPHTVGPDRVCSAAAAFEQVQSACAVASFGTAITVDCVSAEGRFMGGAILPGLQMSLDALHDHTDRLPAVQAAAPQTACGRGTSEAMLAGVVYGAAGALREIVERFATDLRRWPPLIATGGNAPLIQPYANFIDAVVPDLCLRGIALAYRRAAGIA
ncbi:MAG: type III pantothenate kinase [Phycisphaerales bacterium]|nr:type III pantothenate kinase [Phycisphaerales bacterium]